MVKVKNVEHLLCIPNNDVDCLNTELLDCPNSLNTLKLV